MSEQNLLEKVLNTHPNTPDGKLRRMGVEIELAGLNGEEITRLLDSHFSGDIDWLSPFEIELKDSEFGTFKVELDSKAIKKIGAESSVDGNPKQEEKNLESTLIEAVGSLAATLVPWEIVTPPIEFKDLPKLYPLIDELRKAGALGTRHAPHFAFGIHLNPELPSHDPLVIRDYLRAFACLYDWITAGEKTDLSRRITPYINHFDDAYVSKILHHEYQPNLEELIDDYLEHNPTRNRSLDMLPLFKHLDTERVERTVGDERVNARPTFHYRLPNCDIDNPDWNLDESITTWLEVEQLAFDDRLSAVSDEYLAFLNNQSRDVSGSWADHIAKRLNLSETPYLGLSH